jgi:hypothetical protein
LWVLFQTKMSEVIIMVEQKAGSAAKKPAIARTVSKVAGKPKTTKAALTAPAKKTPAKKTAVAEPRKTKLATVKKVAAPAAKKTAAAKKSQAAKIKPAVARLKPAAARKSVQPTPEERYRMVETTAYYIAERHGFQGRSDEHWAAAELEVAARLGQ